MNGQKPIPSRMAEKNKRERNKTYASGIRLDVDAPLGGVETEGFKSTFTTEVLELVDVLVAAVVASARKTLGVLVGQDRTVGLHNSTRGQVLYIDEDEMQRSQIIRGGIRVSVGGGW